MKPIVLCLATALPLLLARAWLPGLADPSEARYGQICREMVEKGEWVVPTWLGIAHLEKPPLAYWSGAIGMRLLGRSEFAARLGALLVFVAAAIWTAGIARRLAGAEAAVPAALAMLLSPFPVAAGVACLTDPFLLAATTLFHHSLVRRLRDGSPRAMDVAALALALGILAKGHMILLFTVLPAALAGTGVLRELVRPRRLLILLAVTVPWFVAIEARFPGFFREQAGKLVGRASGRGRSAPFFVYLLTLAAGFVPFGIYAPRGVARLFPSAPGGGGLARRAWASFRGAPAESRLVLLWLLVPLLVLSAAGSRLWTYVLPAAPPVAVFAGARLAAMRGLPRREAASWVFLAGGVLLIGAAAVRAAPPFLGHFGAAVLLSGAWLLLSRRLSRTVAAAGVSALLVAGIVEGACVHEGAFRIYRTFGRSVADLARPTGAPVVLAGMTLPSIGYYCDRPVKVAGEAGTLAREARIWGESPQYAPEEDLGRLLAEDFTSVIVVDERRLRALAPNRKPVLREGKLVVLFGEGAVSGAPVR